MKSTMATPSFSRDSPSMRMDNDSATPNSLRRATTATGSVALGVHEWRIHGVGRTKKDAFPPQSNAMNSAYPRHGSQQHVTCVHVQTYLSMDPKRRDMSQSHP